MIFIIYLFGLVFCLFGAGFFHNELDNEDGVIIGLSILWPVILFLAIIVGIPYAIFQIGKYFREKNNNDQKSQ